MLALKDTCFRPNTEMPYILSASGGRNNSREGLTVRLALLVFDVY